MMSQPFQKATCLVFKYLALPEPIKAEVKDHHAFRNDILLEHVSPDSGPERGESWGKALAEAVANNWDMTDTDRWLLDCGYDLDDVQRIFFDICW